MKALRVVIMLMSLMVALAWLAAPARAGGWAVITLDDWPGTLVAGKAYTIGFVVRQHGQDDRKMNDLTPTVSFRHAGAGEGLVVDARSDGQDGHYTAEIRLPAAGTWEWSIQAFSMDQPLPALTVIEAAATEEKRASGFPGWVLAAVGGIGLLAALALAGRKRYHWATLAAAAGLALGGFGLASASGQAAQPPVESAPIKQTPAGLGAALFVAKGCISCHANSRIAPELRTFTTELGPNLSDYTASAEYLHLWLKDPRAAKPRTQMPNLELKKVEIDALIAFLSEEK